MKRELVPVLEFIHSSHFGMAKVYVDLSWGARLRRAWGHLWANPDLMQYAVGISPMESNEAEAYANYRFNPGDPNKFN